MLRSLPALHNPAIGWQNVGHGHIGLSSFLRAESDGVHLEPPTRRKAYAQGASLEFDKRHALDTAVTNRLVWTPRAPVPVAMPPVQDVGNNWSIGLRRWLYKSLSPLDRGDFRWEFLVPWTNKTLTSIDKFIICSSFIGIAFTLQTLSAPRASVGVHLSYIAQFFSYAMGDPIGFRILAVLTSVLEIFGQLFEKNGNGILATGLEGMATPDLFEAMRTADEEDVYPVLYDEMFIVINAYYILRWFLSREEMVVALDWSEEEEALYNNCFAGLGFRRAQFTQLLKSASFERSGMSSETLCIQGEPIYDLFVPLSEGVQVRVDGTLATTLPPYQLVGEASLLENLQSRGGELHPASRATIVAPPGSVYVRWPQSAFYELQQEEDSDFAYAIQLMIARQLSDKLKLARLSQQSKVKALGSAGLPIATDEDETAAQAEMRALVERSKRAEQRIAALEKSLEERKQENDDLLAVIIFFAGIVGLGAAAMFQPHPPSLMTASSAS